MKNLFLPVVLAVLVITIQLFIYFGLGKDGITDNIALVAGLNVFLFGVMAFTQPFLMLMLVVCYLPFSHVGIEFEVGVITLNPYSAGMILMVFLSFLRKVILGVKLNLSNTDLALVMVCATFLWSTLTSGNVMDAGLLAFNYIFIPVTSYFSVRLLITDEHRYGITMRAMLASMTVFAVLSILGFMSSGLRAGLTRVYPIDTATLLVLPILYLFSARYYTTLLRKAALIICLTAFFLTFTRMYLVALIICPIFYKIIKSGRSFLAFLAVIAGFLLLTFTMIAGARMLKPDISFIEQSTQQTAKRMTDIEHWKLSLYGRVQLFEQGIHNYTRRPFFGTGLKTGDVLVTQHNFIIEWLEYGGTVGFVLFSLFFLTHAWRMGPLARHDLPIRLNLTALLIVLCNCFTNGIMHGQMPFVAYLLMGLSESRYLHVRDRIEAEEEDEAYGDKALAS